MENDYKIGELYLATEYAGFAEAVRGLDCLAIMYDPTMRMGRDINCWYSRPGELYNEAARAAEDASVDTDALMRRWAVAVNEKRPEYVCLLDTPAGALLGDNLQSAALELEYLTGVTCCAVDTTGTRYYNQGEIMAFDFPVREVVAMGRNPHKRIFEPDTVDDAKIIDAALAHMGMEQLANRSFRQLSGGEKQRVLIARAIAQQTDFLILDEPTNHLDIRYQMQVFEKVRALGVTTLAAIHDMNLAALFCDRIYVMAGGKNYVSGTPDEIMTEELIKDVFDVDSGVIRPDSIDRPHAVFIPNFSTKESEDAGR